MQQTVMVMVENIKNPAIKRQMTVNSAKMNSKKWRIVSDEVPAAQDVKKKAVVKPVAESDSEVIVETAESGNSFVNEFATIGDETPSEKALLQKEYEELSGSKPDGRWNEAKLKEKIATLKNPAA